MNLDARIRRPPKTCSGVPPSTRCAASPSSTRHGAAEPWPPWRPCRLRPRHHDRVGLGPGRRRAGARAARTSRGQRGPRRPGGRAGILIRRRRPSGRAGSPPGQGDRWSRALVLGRRIRARVRRPGGQVVALDIADGSVRVLAECDDAQRCFVGVSPDTTHIAFGVDGGLLVRSEDGETMLPLADVSPAPLSTTAPVWSPDGTRLAFSTPKGLWVVDVDGTDLRLLVRSPDVRVMALPPSWSPDGRSLAYLAGTPVREVRPQWEHRRGALLRGHRRREYGQAARAR